MEEEKKPEKVADKLYRTGKITFHTTVLGEGEIELAMFVNSSESTEPKYIGDGDNELAMFVNSAESTEPKYTKPKYIGYAILRTNIPIKDLGNPRHPKPNFLFVHATAVFDAYRGKGYGYILYREALKLARKNGYEGLCSAKNHESHNAEDMWKNFKSSDDNDWNYAAIGDLGNRISEETSPNIIQELKITYLNKADEDIYFIAYKEHLFLLDENSDYTSLEPYFKDHPQFKNQTRNVFNSGSWYDFISEIVDYAPGIMVGQYDPIQKILTLNSRGHFNIVSSLILKKVIKQLGIKKVESNVLQYDGDDKYISYGEDGLYRYGIEM